MSMAFQGYTRKVHAGSQWTSFRESEDPCLPPLLTTVMSELIVYPSELSDKAFSYKLP